MFVSKTGRESLVAVKLSTSCVQNFDFVTRCLRFVPFIDFVWDSEGLRYSVYKIATKLGSKMADTCGLVAFCQADHLMA